MSGLPDGLLVAFYGDDFTGSTAVMEVLSFAGLPTVLFLEVPTAERLAAFEGYRGVGVAGVARARSPAWMERHLPPVFDFLAGLNAPIAHYKVCSTLDSAPHTGSIGKAADLAIPRLGGDWTPVLIAAPAIARYQAFGNLFALVDGIAYRLDRHPTMSRHPVTPMTEADVRRHLARQTERPIGLVDLIALKAGRGAVALERAGELVALDVVDEETLRAAGRLVWEQRGERLFAVGAQGLEYALVAHWQATGLLPDPPPPPQLDPAERVAVVSGSCSPMTARQIDHAAAHGFTVIPLDARKAVDPRAWRDEIDGATERARAELSDGRDPLVCTARGPDDPAIAALNEAIASSGADAEAVHERVGQGLGRLLAALIDAAGVRRAVVAGGDSSGNAALTLGIHALTALAPIAPGSMVCRAHREGGEIELALKGGQMGGPDYFSAVKRGRA